MISRVFILANDDRAALERLGAALVLQWVNVPSGLQDSLVQQAVALDWNADPDSVARQIRKLVHANEGTEPPAGSDEPVPS